MLILQKFICKHDYKTILMIIRPMSSVTIGVLDKMSDVNIMDKMNGHVRDGMRIRLGRISVQFSNYLTSKYDDLHIFKFQIGEQDYKNTQRYACIPFTPFSLVSYA